MCGPEELPVPVRPKGCIHMSRLYPARIFFLYAPRSSEVLPLATSKSPSSSPTITWFLSSPFLIRVPFSLPFGFSKGALKYKGQKGTTQGPRVACTRTSLPELSAGRPGVLQDHRDVRSMSQGGFLLVCRELASRAPLRDWQTPGNSWVKVPIYTR